MQATDQRIRQAVVNVQRTYCQEVDLDGCVSQIVRKQCRKMHQGLLICWEQVAVRTQTSVLPTKIKVQSNLDYPDLDYPDFFSSPNFVMNIH